MLSDLRIIFCVCMVIGNICPCEICSGMLQSVVTCQGSDCLIFPEKFKRTLLSVALPYLILSSSVSVLMVLNPILDVPVASLASLMLQCQQISPKTLPDITRSTTVLLRTDTERVFGLKKQSEDQSFVQSFHPQTCPWGIVAVRSRSVADP